MVAGVVRVARVVVRGFLKHDCALHAAGLTYFSLLTAVPILCLLLMLAQTVGVAARAQINDRIEAAITEFEQGRSFVPDMLEAVGAADMANDEQKKAVAAAFGAQARAFSNALIDQAEKFDFRALGWVGFGFLLWSVISTLGMVEVAFNRIWGVKRDRPIWKRAYLYLVVSTVLPLLVAVALSLPVMGVAKNVIAATAGVTAPTKYLGDFLIGVLESRAVSLFFTFAFATAAFTFLFKFMPHVLVRWRAAAAGGAVTAVVFGLWLKVCAIAQVGIASSNALYGSFAFLPIVLAWLYMSWQIVLLGANLSCALQQMFFPALRCKMPRHEDDARCRIAASGTADSRMERAQHAKLGAPASDSEVPPVQK